MLHHPPGGRKFADRQAGARDADLFPRLRRPVIGAKGGIKQQEIQPEEQADRPCPGGEEEAAIDKAGQAGEKQEQPETPSAKRTVRNEFRRENRLVVERIHVAFLKAGWL